MKRVLLFLFLLLAGIINKGYAKGVPENTRITNWATVSYTTGIFKKVLTNYISTNVMAVYGVSSVNGETNGFTYSGGSIDFTYSITNNGNTSMRVFVIISNFTMNGGYSGSDWQALFSTNSSFSPASTITGTNTQSITNKYNLDVNEIFPFYIRIITANDSAPTNWGFIPTIIEASNKGNYLVHYRSTNGNYYGGYTNRIIYPKVTIKAPFISLKKALSISNTSIYLASGGLTNIPVPEAIITYTNYYDNDGNATATNLIIIDKIPYHTDFIIGSINNANYTGGTLTIRYYDNNNNLYTPTGAAGSYDPNVRKIEFSFENSAAIGAGDDDGGTDNYGTADGAFPDTDAGWVSYKVIVHKRE